MLVFRAMPDVPGRAGFIEERRDEARKPEQKPDCSSPCVPKGRHLLQNGSAVTLKRGFCCIYLSNCVAGWQRELPSDMFVSHII